MSELRLCASHSVAAAAADRSYLGFSGLGSAYVFTKPAEGWHSMTETTRLDDPDLIPGDGYGISVAIDGETVVIGAYPTGAPRRPPRRFWSTSRARGPFRSLWSCRKAVERWVGAAGLETALNPDWAVGKKRSLGAARRARL